jgi:hypothetical protein
MQDLDEIWFEFLFESCFKSGAATWLSLIGPYRFGRIRVKGRRMLRGSDAQDLTVPIRLSDLIWTT